MCHSDRDGQFRAKKIRWLLANIALVSSIGRSYGPGDNAGMESLFALLQKNVLDPDVRTSARTLASWIVTWIETKYNRRRRQWALGRLTSVEFESIYSTAEAA